MFKRLALLLSLLGALGISHAQTLTIGYSDWPGWVAWEVGIEKGWFEEADVDVVFEWFDYVASMDAYAAGQLDAVCMTNGDALVTGATARTLGNGTDQRLFERKRHDRRSTWNNQCCRVGKQESRGGNWLCRPSALAPSFGEKWTVGRRRRADQCSNQRDANGFSEWGG